MRDSTTVMLFPQMNEIFLGCFDPINAWLCKKTTILLYNTNNQCSVWPKQYLSCIKSTAPNNNDLAFSRPKAIVRPYLLAIHLAWKLANIATSWMIGCHTIFITFFCKVQSSPPVDAKSRLNNFYLNITWYLNPKHNFLWMWCIS